MEQSNSTTLPILPIPSIPSDLLCEIAARTDPIEWEKLSQLFPSIDWQQVLRLATLHEPFILLCNAIKQNNIFLVKLLLTDTRVDPAIWCNTYILGACDYGHLEIVKLLLSHPKIDPSASKSAAFTRACGKGHLDVVALLLQDGRVDPSDQDNAALCLASGHGHTQVVRLLLSDPRVNPSARNNFPMRAAIHRKHLGVIGLLSQCKDVQFPQ